MGGSGGLILNLTRWGFVLIISHLTHLYGREERVINNWYTNRCLRNKNNVIVSEEIISRGLMKMISR